MAEYQERHVLLNFVGRVHKLLHLTVVLKWWPSGAPLHRQKDYKFPFVKQNILSVYLEA